MPFVIMLPATVATFATLWLAFAILLFILEAAKNPVDVGLGDVTVAAALATIAVVFALYAIALWGAAWVTLISIAH